MPISVFTQLPRYGPTFLRRLPGSAIYRVGHVLSCKRHATKGRPQAVSSGLGLLRGGEDDAMARISDARVSCKTFADKPVEPELLLNVFRTAQRVPTSFNTQPYRVVVVSSKEAKASLAPTMMKTNREKVMNAAVTVVVLSDLEVDATRTTELTKEAAPHLGTYAEMIPDLIPVFAGNEGKNTTTEWAFKNAGLLGMRLLDTATAHGLATAMLEGIEDEEAMLKVIGAPSSRYRVPFVICIGYPDREAESARLESFAGGRSPRFSLEDVVSTDFLSNAGLMGFKD